MTTYGSSGDLHAYSSVRTRAQASGYSFLNLSLPPGTPVLLVLTSLKNIASDEQISGTRTKSDSNEKRKLQGSLLSDCPGQYHG